MGELSRAAGRPSTVTIEHDGKQWELSPLCLGDFAKFETWLEMLPLENVKPHLEGLPADERKMLLEKAYEQCNAGEASLTSVQGIQAMRTLRGVQVLLYLSLKKKHPDITKEQASETVDMTNMQEIQDAISLVSGIQGDGEIGSDPTSTETLSGATSSGTSEKPTDGPLM